MAEFPDRPRNAIAFPAVIPARNASRGLAAGLAEGLRTSDAVRVEGAFAADRIAALRAEAVQAHAAGRFTAARVGRARHADRALRGDELCWLDDATGAPAAAALLAELDALRGELDRALLLGTRAVEAQFARYAPGTGYARHLDRVAGDADAGRVLSLVLYLNAGWSATDGGALRLFDAAGAGHDVMPVGGDLVAFLSDRVAHEVLPATRVRWSVAAWLTRTDPASPAPVHPPHSSA